MVLCFDPRHLTIILRFLNYYFKKHEHNLLLLSLIQSALVHLISHSIPNSEYEL